jgi:hypothetical protein
MTLLFYSLFIKIPDIKKWKRLIFLKENICLCKKDLIEFEVIQLIEFTCDASNAKDPNTTKFEEKLIIRESKSTLKTLFNLLRSCKDLECDGKDDSF